MALNQSIKQQNGAIFQLPATISLPTLYIPPTHKEGQTVNVPLLKQQTSQVGSNTTVTMLERPIQSLLQTGTQLSTLHNNAAMMQGVTTAAVPQPVAAQAPAPVPVPVPAPAPAVHPKAEEGSTVNVNVMDLQHHPVLQTTAESVSITANLLTGGAPQGQGAGNTVTMMDIPIQSAQLQTSQAGNTSSVNTALDTPIQTLLQMGQPPAAVSANNVNEVSMVQTPIQNLLPPQPTNPTMNLLENPIQTLLQAPQTRENLGEAAMQTSMPSSMETQSTNQMSSMIGTTLHSLLQQTQQPVKSESMTLLEAAIAVSQGGATSYTMSMIPTTLESMLQQPAGSQSLGSHTCNTVTMIESPIQSLMQQQQQQPTSPDSTTEVPSLALLGTVPPGGVVGALDTVAPPQALLQQPSK